MKRKKGEITRKHIIDSALKLFIEEGYHSTSTRQIMELAGLSPAALYNHFDGKEDIFRAVIEIYHPWLRIPECLSNSQGEDMESYIRNAFELLINTWNEQSGMMRLHLIELLEFKGQHLPSLFKSVFSDATRMFTSIIKDRDMYKDTDPSLFARGVLGLFFNYMLSNISTTGMSENLIPDRFDYFADLYLQGFLNMEANPVKKK